MQELAGGGTVYKTSDGGHFWQSLYDTSNDISGGVSAIGIAPQDPNIVFVSTAFSGDVFRTTDGGISWVRTGLLTGIAQDFEFGDVSSSIYLGARISSFLPKGLLQSSDTGMTWRSMHDSIPGEEISCYTLAIKRKGQKRLYAGVAWQTADWSAYGSGVYSSSMDGIWDYMGLDSCTVYSLKFSPDEKYLYAGVAYSRGGKSKGVYRADILTSVHEEVEKLKKGERPMLFQNYPNPFNPVTQIKYALPEDVHVTLKIFDVLGREVAMPVDGFETAGYKSVEFDALKSPSGVYFYRMQAGKFTQVKKMLLAK